MKRKKKRRHRTNRALKNHLWFNTFGPVSQVPCHWCQAPLSFDEATVDHEPPLAEGGHQFSAVIACFHCNNWRSREQMVRMAKPAKEV